MDAGLASWLDAGLYFDYLGFDIFYRIEGSGPTAAADPRIPVQFL